MIRKILLSSLLVFSACNNPSSPLIPATGSGRPSPTTPIPIKESTLGATLGINESVDLRAFDAPIVNQFGESCTAFATAAAMDNLFKKKGINKLVSERHLWSTYSIGDLNAAIAAASSNYITEEQYWPINSTPPINWQYMDHASLKITQVKNDQYDMNAALQGLSQGHPIVMGIQVPSSLENCDADIDPNSSATTGEHAIEAVGYRLDDSVSGGGYFILKNSWGNGCGDQGYHYYPFSLCTRSDLFCYFTEILEAEDRAP